MKFGSVCRSAYFALGEQVALERGISITAGGWVPPAASASPGCCVGMGPREGWLLLQQVTGRTGDAGINVLLPWQQRLVCSAQCLAPELCLCPPGWGGCSLAPWRAWRGEAPVLHPAAVPWLSRQLTCGSLVRVAKGVRKGRECCPVSQVLGLMEQPLPHSQAAVHPQLWALNCLNRCFVPTGLMYEANDSCGGDNTLLLV